METTMKLEIDRRKWLRGEYPSRLLRVSSRKQCCVGIYLSALGVPDEALLDRCYADSCGVGPLPEEARWLLGHSADAHALYVRNDDAMAEETREIAIAAIFAKHGIEVTFTN